MAVACFRHPGVEAVTKCTRCAQPICQDCLLYRDGMVYCSEGCAVAQNALGNQISQKMKNRYGPGLLASWSKVLILAVVVWLILEWLGITTFLPYGWLH